MDYVTSQTKLFSVTMSSSVSFIQDDREMVHPYFGEDYNQREISNQVNRGEGERERETLKLKTKPFYNNNNNRIQ